MGMSPRKTNRPTLDEYFGLEAIKYGTSTWMARNQIRTTQRAIDLLESPALGGPLQIPPYQLLFLDIGAGTGYSSHVLLEKQIKVIGIDFSHDMLIQCPSHPNLSRIQADMRF